MEEPVVVDQDLFTIELNYETRPGSVFKWLDLKFYFNENHLALKQSFTVEAKTLYFTNEALCRVRDPLLINALKLSGFEQEDGENFILVRILAKSHESYGKMFVPVLTEKKL